MKTGIISADPRKTCWKIYSYHGIMMRCRVGCLPDPWWTPPIGPVVNPPTFRYEANVLPLENPDKLVRIYSMPPYLESIVGSGLYLFEGADSRNSVRADYNFSAKPVAYSELHISASVPAMSVAPGYKWYDGFFHFYVDYPHSFFFSFHQSQRENSSGKLVETKNILIDMYPLGSWTFPFDPSCSVDIVRRAGSDLWDFYYNGIFLASASGTYATLHEFNSQIDGYNGKVYLDYFRMWVDIPVSP